VTQTIQPDTINVSELVIAKVGYCGTYVSVLLTST